MASLSLDSGQKVSFCEHCSCNLTWFCTVILPRYYFPDRTAVIAIPPMTPFAA